MITGEDTKSLLKMELAIIFLIANLWGSFGAPATPLCGPLAGQVPLERVQTDVGFDAFKIGGDQCHWHMFTADETRACLAGKWVMIFGGSNAYSMIGGVLGLITQAPYDFPRREWLNCTYCDEWSGAPTIIDMIVAQNGTVVYSGVPTWDGVWSPEAWQYDPGLDPTREAMMHKILDEAPLPSPEDVRITWMYTRFFTAVHLQTLSAWSRVPFMPAPEVHVNIGVWYSACTWGWGTLDFDSNSFSLDVWMPIC
jgi:hypothetical protein